MFKKIGKNEIFLFGSFAAVITLGFLAWSSLTTQMEHTEKATVDLCLAMGPEEFIKEFPIANTDATARYGVPDAHHLVMRSSYLKCLEVIKEGLKK